MHFPQNKTISKIKYLKKINKNSIHYLKNMKEYENSKKELKYLYLKLRQIFNSF
jgi:hypothetical protein